MNPWEFLWTMIGWSLVGLGFFIILVFIVLVAFVVVRLIKGDTKSITIMKSKKSGRYRDE